MNARHTFAALLTAATLIFTAGVAQAELPPDAYAEYQQNAPEALKIQVQSVSSNGWRTNSGVTYNIEVTAKVIGGERTSTGLRNGSMIKIRYQTHQANTPMPGPSAIPVLRRGQQCDAFLQRASDGSYRPVARGYSFEKVHVDYSPDTY